MYKYLLLTLIFVAGCTGDQLQKGADTTKKVETGLTTGKEILNSPVVQTVALATGTEPIRQGLVELLGGLIVISGGLSAWLAKKAAARKAKEKVLRRNMDVEQQAKANQEIYGAKYNPLLVGK